MRSQRHQAQHQSFEYISDNGDMEEGVVQQARENLEDYQEYFREMDVDFRQIVEQVANRSHEGENPILSVRPQQVERR